MLPPGCSRIWNFGTELQAAASPIGSAFAIVLMLIVFTGPPAQAQVFTTLHAFTGGGDGSAPYAGLSMDRAGNLYGTASFGGHSGGACGGGCGTVFKMERNGSSWLLVPLYAFGGPDGATPQARVIIGPSGNLYGTTTYGGSAGKGVVFRLQPPPAACKTALCPWRETVLYSFAGGSDGAYPTFGDLTFDRQGNIYGTTPDGGSGSCAGVGCGVVYELSPSSGGWTEKILYSFRGGQDGLAPYAGVVFDNAGNLYGTAAFGGTGQVGIVYKLAPSGSGWTESTIYTFTQQSDGGEPYGGLIFDAAGNLYGTTLFGTVYEMTPSSGGWAFQLLYTFMNVYEGSSATLTFDSAGNLYGTLADAAQEVFRLTPSGGQWTLTGFAGDIGAFPLGNVVLDASGNLYTTAAEFGQGYVFEVTP
jgi:uncharacterized repeat protein (TIGR03803 family)